MRLRALWCRLSFWVKALALLVGVSLLSIAPILAVAIATVWYESPLGCPPTMGCPDRSTPACGGSLLTRFGIDSSCNK